VTDEEYCLLVFHPFSFARVVAGSVQLIGRFSCFNCRSLTS
jgi:hypothetical protein